MTTKKRQAPITPSTGFIAKAVGQFLEVSSMLKTMVLNLFAL